MATLPCTPPGQLYYPANCTIADAPCATFKCKSCNSVLYVRRRARRGRAGGFMADVPRLPTLRHARSTLGCC
jgi:hypothetical protein